MGQAINDLSDAELMSAYQKGDEIAFLEIYERYHERVFSYLQKRIRNDMVNDLYQDVFLKLHEKKHLYKRDYAFAPWFFTMIRNSTIDFFRKKRINTELLSENFAQNSAEESLDLESFGLGEADQILLYKKFVEGKAYKELSEEFSLSSAGLRKKVSRLIKNIRLGGAHE
jgi:RNA polymerase sigma-70 factor, ECF subfamily